MRSRAMASSWISSMRAFSIGLGLVALLLSEQLLSAESKPLSKEALCGVVQEHATEAWTARQNGIAARDYRARETEESYERMGHDDLTDAEQIARNFAAGFSVTFSFDQRLKTEEMTVTSHGLIAKETCLSTNLYTRYIRGLERYRSR